MSIEALEPQNDRDEEGGLTITLNNKFTPDDDIKHIRTLERIIKTSRCLDLESLCIVSQQIVWNVQL